MTTEKNKNTDEKIIETEKIENKTEVYEHKKTEKKSDVEKKEIKITKPKVKKNEAVVNISNVAMSTKYSMYVCKFIKGKKVDVAIKDLEEVIAHKKVVPMSGEIPHRKGKGISSGRYPENVARYFIKILKSVKANASANEINEPIIVEAIANMGSKPFGRFGTIRRKRTHVKIKVKENKKSGNKIKTGN